MDQTQQGADSFDIIAHHGAGDRVVTVDRAELERLRTFQDEHMTPLLAELEQLRAQRAAALALADTAEHGATRWADPLPVPEWVGRLRTALGATGEPAEAKHCPSCVSLDTGEHCAGPTTIPPAVLGDIEPGYGLDGETS